MSKAKASSTVSKAVSRAAAAATARLPATDVRTTFMPAVTKADNLLDILFSFRDFGIGKQFTRKPWGVDEKCYWTVTKVIPEYNSPLRKRAKVYGVLTWHGQVVPRELRIPSSLKREWVELSSDSSSGNPFISTLSSISSTPSSSSSTASETTN